MTQEQLEHYTMIAEFLEARTSDKRKYKDYYFPFPIRTIVEDDPFSHPPSYDVMEVHWCNIKDFEFHTSWEWLMKLVIAINSVPMDVKDQYADHVERSDNSTLESTCLMHRNGDGQIFVSTDISGVYKTCIKFLKWYYSK